MVEARARLNGTDRFSYAMMREMVNGDERISSHALGL